MRLHARFPSFARVPRLFNVAAISACIAWSIAAPVHARPVTPRGPLTPEERLTIDIFDKSKRSVVYISTSQQVRDLW